VFRRSATLGDPGLRSLLGLCPGELELRSIPTAAAAELEPASIPAPSMPRPEAKLIFVKLPSLERRGRMSGEALPKESLGGLYSS
jgi:hypothetical protein